MSVACTLHRGLFILSHEWLKNSQILNQISRCHIISELTNVGISSEARDLPDVTPYPIRNFRSLTQDTE
jgi:hypothetical protein